MAGPRRMVTGPLAGLRFCLYFEERPRSFPYRLRWGIRERKNLRMTGVFALHNWKARRAAGRAV